MDNHKSYFCSHQFEFWQSSFERKKRRQARKTDEWHHNAIVFLEDRPTSANYSQTNNCSAGVAAGGNCTVNVSFTPTTAGIIGGTLTFTDSGTGAVQTVPLTGTGISADGSFFSPSSVTFANQSVGSSSPASVVTLTDTGTAALTITSVTSLRTNGGDFSQTNTCGSSIAAGGSCSINAVFKPTASGTRSGSISVADSAAGSPQTLSLTGTESACGYAVADQPYLRQLLGRLQQQSSECNVEQFRQFNSEPHEHHRDWSGSFGLHPDQHLRNLSRAATNCTISVTFTPVAAGSRSATLRSRTMPPEVRSSFL